MVTHVEIDDAEVGALLDMNTSNPLDKNCQGELEALTSPRCSAALKPRHIRLLTYRQMIDMHGLQVMRRPEGQGRIRATGGST